MIRLHFSSAEALVRAHPAQHVLLVTLNADIYRLLRGSDVIHSPQRVLFGFDGRPLHWIAKRNQIERDPGLLQGSEFINVVAKNAPEKRIFLVGGLDSVNQIACENLRKRGVSCVEGWAPSVSDGNLVAELVRRCGEYRPDYVFLCFGCPAQERVALSAIKLLDTALPPIVFVGAGGTVDFVADRFRRAPLALQVFGLEGVYRLIQQPSWKRLARLATSIVGLAQWYRDLRAGRIRVCTR